MHKLTFISFVGVFALLLAGFGPRPWEQSAAFQSQVSISPFEMTVAATPMVVAPASDTF
jgi:hypothetical protein